MNPNSTTTTSTATSATSASVPQSLAKEKYRSLKRKFKFLVYENECYQEELRNLQRRLLKLSRDKNFLLDRLMQYEKVSDSSDDSDPPAPTTNNPSESPKPKKQKKSYPSSKKSRAKQPPAQPNAPDGAAPPTILLPTTPANAAALIRSRSRKGNGTGSSSDAEAVASTSSSSGMIGPVVEIERLPIHIVQQYQGMGVYEPQLPPPPPLALANDHQTA